MSKVFSISREYGSGGHDVVEALCSILEIPYYDRKIVEKELVRQGFPEGFADVADDYKNSKVYFYGSEIINRFEGMSAKEISFELEKDMIHRVADEGDCIILDRCAKEILEDSDHQVANIFISASYEYRLKRIMEREGLTEKKAAALMKREEKRRKEYYEYHTGKNWGVASSYDFCINAESMGLRAVCAILVEAYGKFERTF